MALGAGWGPGAPLPLTASCWLASLVHSDPCSVLLRVVEANGVIPVRPRGTAGSAAGPGPSREGAEEPSSRGSFSAPHALPPGLAAPGPACQAAAGLPSQQRLLIDAPRGLRARRLLLGTLTAPCSRCLETGPGGAAPRLWSRPGNPPLSSTEQGPHRLKSGFASCFCQGP